MTLSLAEALRRFDDNQLAELFAARRDLTAPAPSSISQLAARATTMVSARRALEVLRRPELQLLEVIVALTPAAPVDLAALETATGAATDELSGLLRRLRVLGLIYADGAPTSTPSDIVLTPVRVLTDLLPHPAGLAAPCSEDPSAADAHRTVATARAASPELAALLDSLAFGPARLRGGTESPAAKALVNAGVARVLTGQDSAHGDGADQLELPRSVQLAMRAPRVVEQLALQIPQGEAAQPERFPGGRQAEALERASAMDRLVGDVQQWDQDPPTVLKRGGISQRDAKRWAQRWGVSGQECSLALTAAWRAGLLAHDGDHWQCTREFDEFRRQALPMRWAELVVTWASSSHLAALAGTPVDDATGTGQRGPARSGRRAALSDQTLRTPARRRRRRLLRHLAAHPAQVFTADLIHQVLSWLFPLLPGPVARQEAEFLHTEASAWGLLVDSVPTPLLTKLAEGLDDPMPAAITQLAEVMQQALPPAVDQLLLDGDLTLTVPGRPSDAIAPVLAWAEGESHGAGYQGRFTPESVAGAVQNGGDVQELLTQLRSLSLTPVPQALEYLLLDQARRHGQVQVQAASTVITGDEEHLDQLLASPHAAPLGLTRVASTVLIAVAAPGFAVGQIRQAGLAPSVTTGTEAANPAAADAAGTPQSLGRRTHTLRGRQARVDPTGLDEVELSVDPNDPALQVDPRTAVSRLRTAESAPGLHPQSVSDAILAAIGDHRQLRIGVVDGRGGIEEMLVQPLSLEGGRLRARRAQSPEPGQSGEEFTVLIHRVTLG